MRANSTGGRTGLHGVRLQSHAATRNQGSKSVIALRALDRFCAGVIVTDGDGQVVEMNWAAVSLTQLDERLIVRDGRLCTGRVFESASLAKLIARAAGNGAGAVGGRMLVGRSNPRPAYVLTIAPLVSDPGIGYRQLVMIVVIDPERHFPSEGDLVDLFGLSRAEVRLAVALISGRRLSTIAGDFGVQVTTLRTQIRSILKKVGAERQSDLIRVLSSAGIGSVLSAAGWLDVALEALELPLSLAGV